MRHAAESMTSGCHRAYTWTSPCCSLCLHQVLRNNRSDRETRDAKLMDKNLYSDIANSPA